MSETRRSIYNFTTICTALYDNLYCFYYCFFYFIYFVYFSVHCTLCIFVIYNHCCLVRINKWMDGILFKKCLKKLDRIIINHSLISKITIKHVRITLIARQLFFDKKN